MTKKELSQLSHLKKEIEGQKLRLAYLESAACRTSQSLAAVPGGGGERDRVGDGAAAIADLKDLIAQNIERCLLEERRLERYIEGISDSFLRQTFILRFCEQKTWNEIADIVGGSENSVRMSVNRYIDKTNKCSICSVKAC